MSYIVKSKNFPKSCNKCDEPHLCCDFYYCGVGYQKDGRHLDVDEHYLNKTKHPDCPLLELPKKHGRLIDADRLLKVLSKNSIISKITYANGNSIEDIIRNAPTIIETEVSE